MDEFLYVLKLRLMDHLMPQELDEQIALYENYINEEMAGGKTLEQVMRKLGDPEKVAEMIIVHKKGEDTPEEEELPEEEAGETAQERMKRLGEMSADEINEQVHNPERGFHAEFKENEGWDIRLGKVKLNSWYGTLIILGIVLAVFILFSELTH